MKQFRSIVTLRRAQVILALLLMLTSVSFFLPRGVQAADGDLDATFGTGDASVPAGVARTFFGANSLASQDAVAALAFQSVGGNAGKIIAAGFAVIPGVGGSNSFALARYTTAGMLDTTFGPMAAMGKVTTTFPSTSFAQANDVAVGADDRVVAVGSANFPTGMQPCSSVNNDFAIAVYDANGNLDTGFDGDGKLTIDFFGCNDSALSTVVQPDGKIVVLGFATQDLGMFMSNFFLVLARFNADGTPDTTFNGGNGANMTGRVTHLVTTGTLGTGNDVRLVTSGPHAGKFVVVGQGSTAMGGADFMVARFTSNGSLDSGLGGFGPSNTGFVLTDIGTAGSDSAVSVAIQPDGKIIAGGSKDSDFAMARYSDDGLLDTGADADPGVSFGTGGKVVTDFGDMMNFFSDTGKFVGVMSNGKIVMTGQTQGNFMNLIGVARYNSDGTLDNTFGPSMNGKMTTHLGQNMGTDNAVLSNAGALQTDDKILVAGQINTSAQSDTDFVVARFQNGAAGGGPCTLNEIKKLSASDGVAGDGMFDPGDNFGEGVAIDGDTAVVVAPLHDLPMKADAGAAYVFYRNQGGMNNWGQVKKLVASDGAAFDKLGNFYSVAISGDTIIIGAREHNMSQGAVYIFDRNQGGADNWGEVKKLSVAVTNAQFGISVGISGDTAVVGASGALMSGRAYVFGRNQGGANNWGQVKELANSDAANGDSFGRSVAVNSDTVVVGASNKNSFAGAAYVFDRNLGGADNWGERKKLTASDTMPSDSFGIATSISGDTAIVGAFGDDMGKGSAYVFDRNQGGMDNWGEVKKIVAIDGIAAANDFFGNGVSISGDTALIGARGNNTGKGAAYNHNRDQGGMDNWGEVHKLTASDGLSQDGFGRSVSVSGTTAIIGAVFDDMGKGSAYIFACSSPPPPACTLTCPANITTTADQMCGKVVNYAAPGTSGTCGTVTCSPPSGSCFAVGATTVNCTSTQGGGACSFTVTVNPQPCMITCPANVTVSNEANQCGAVVNYPAPTTSGSCGTVTCSPPSGSFFPVGTTTVNCDASGTPANPDCSFSVTVTDTQPPVVTCPANVAAVAPATCPPSSSAVVNYAAPQASDNCPGVTVACVPPAGSSFPVGTTMVTCTATDAAGNTATCSFAVTVFNGCLQDDSNPANVVLFNTVTGEYRFCCGGVVVKTGVGTVTRQGCMVTIQHNAADRRVLIKADFAAKSGTASLQAPPGVVKCAVTDKNTQNNACQCQ